jgi:hypothetical protein
MEALKKRGKPTPWLMLADYAATCPVQWAEFSCSLKFICWNYNPNVMVFSGGRRWLCHEGRALMNGINVLIRDPWRVPSPLLLCEVPVRRQLSVDQEVGPHQTLNLPVPWSWPFKPPDYEKSMSVAHELSRLWYFVIAAHGLRCLDKASSIKTSHSSKDNQTAWVRSAGLHPSKPTGILNSIRTKMPFYYYMYKYSLPPRKK